MGTDVAVAVVNNSDGFDVNVTQLLEALHPRQADLKLKADAFKQVKSIIKSASDDFWKCNGSQILSALLEAFHPVIIAQLGTKTNLNHSLQLEGICESSTASDAGMSQFSASPTDSNRGLLDSLNASCTTADMTRRLTGLTPQKSQISKTAGEMGKEDENVSPKMSLTEMMHWACKIILLLVRHRGILVKGFMELLVSRLCETSIVAPIAVILHCQQILCDLASIDHLSAQRMSRLLLPYIRAPIRLQTTTSDCRSLSESSKIAGSKTILAGGTRLMALQVLSSCVKNLTSPLLLEDLKEICASVLPLFGSAVVDERKAVVFILVEMYMVVGDALHPFVNELPVQQRKLLTIYIDKQLAT